MGRGIILYCNCGNINVPMMPKAKWICTPDLQPLLREKHQHFMERGHMSVSW